MKAACWRQSACAACALLWVFDLSSERVEEGDDSERYVWSARLHLL